MYILLWDWQGQYNRYPTMQNCLLHLTPNTWYQQLPTLLDKGRQKLFLPPRFHRAYQRFCGIPAG
jgi:hypothetical protein